MYDLKPIHSSCHSIFRKSFYKYPENEENQEIEYHGPSSACKIYDKLTEGDQNKQNSIGENFNKLINLVDDNWFQAYSPKQDLEYYFMNYCILLYLFVERVEIIFQVINKDGKSKLFNDYRFNNFKTLTKITKWANFFKHPKEFLFTHFATFYFEGDKEIVIHDGDVKVDTDFIFNHYDNEKQPRPVILENNESVLVEVPNLEKLTTDFCYEMNLFFDFICSNQVVADFLKNKSTIKNHWYYNIDDIEILNPEIFEEKAKETTNTVPN